MGLLSRVRKNPVSWLLAAIVIFGLILRFLAAKPGYFSHGDELMYAQAIYMFKNKTLSMQTHWMGYPPLVAWIMLVFFIFIYIPLGWISYFVVNIQDLAAQLGGMYQTSGPVLINLKNAFDLRILGPYWINALYWGRYVTAIFGAGVIYLTYKVAYEFFKNNFIALVSAFLVAINYRLVFSSSIGFIDMYNVFFMLGCLLFAAKILKKPTIKNYFLAWVFVALSFITKYQIYGLITLFVSHIFASMADSKRGRVAFWRVFLRKEVIVGGVTSLLIVVVSHIHYFPHIDRIREIHDYEVLKYAFGNNTLNFFPVSYLFNIGIGPFLSILALAGIAKSLIDRKSAVLTLVALSSFPLTFYIYLYYTAGGFFTRNLIVVIPIFLIFAALFINYLSGFFKKYFFLGASLLIFFAVKEHIINTFKMVDWYASPSPRTQAKEWALNNISGNVVFGTNYPEFIPRDSKVKSIELPSVYKAYSYQELLKEGYDIAAVNISELHSYHSTWWMRSSTLGSRIYWNIPYGILSQDYRVMALRELFWNNTLASFITGWQAPGYNFGIFRINKDNSCQDIVYKKIGQSDSFVWKALTYSSDSKRNFEKHLSIQKGFLKPGFGRWQTEAVNATGEKCYKVKGTVVLSNKVPKEERGAFLRIDFYENNPQADIEGRSIITFLSERAYGEDGRYNFEIIAKSPENAKYVTIGFQTDSAIVDYSLKDLEVYESEEKVAEDETKRVILKDEMFFLPNNEGIL